MKSVFAFVGIYMLTGSEGQTRYIIDDDWQLGIKYPWPFDVCVQTVPAVTLAQQTPEYAYYECSADGQSVTKYTWNATQVADFTDFDCMDSAGAVDSRAVTETILFDASKTSCDTGYFECTGDHNYATAIFRGALGMDCSQAIFELTVSIATDVCYCDTALNISGEIGCSPTESLAYNYTDTACTVNGSPPSRVLGRAHECAFFTEVEYELNGNPLTIYVFGEMAGCVAAGQQTIVASDSPTSSPSKSPTTSPPTQAPVIKAGASALAACNPFAMLILAALFLFAKM